jgi:Arc/MetJ-type ribon-helix-helix transcriptional regulator
MTGNSVQRNDTMTEKDKSGFTSITIPAHIGEKIEKRIAGTEFSSVSEYVAFVMNEVVSDATGGGEEKVSFSKEDEEQVKERLRALGYID